MRGFSALPYGAIMSLVVPHVDSLQRLAEDYLAFLATRDEDYVKRFLSLNFILRQRVSEQIRLIKELPQLLYGLDIEVNLYRQYDVGLSENNLQEISPFQFQISYSHPVNLVDIEKTTITVHSVVLEDGQWKISSIISEDDKGVLRNVIEKIKKMKSSSV